MFPETASPKTTLLSPARRLSRRQVLGGMLGLSAASLMPWATWAWASESHQVSEQEIADFLALSERLTGRESLDAKIAGRAYNVLMEAGEDFPARQRQLSQAMEQASLTDMRKFKAFAETQNQTVVDTAIAIISAWYLGYTGTPKGHSATDDTRFVTYTGALMFEPTIDATVIPTYSRGRTNYWKNPPETLATD